jgi:peptide/nickel transport system permease protein
MTTTTLSPNPAKPSIDGDEIASVTYQQNESYFQLVMRRFSRSRISIVGGLIVIMLATLSFFAEFFSPNPLNKDFLKDAFIAPNQIRFIDTQGNFSLRPFVYGQAIELDPNTFQPAFVEDTKKKYSLKFFTRGWEYELLFGLIKSDLHLFGVEDGGKLYMLGTDKLGRDVWGKALQAGRISLSLGLMTTLFTVFVGSIIGITSGYKGGLIDEAIQRLVEFIGVFPGLPLLMSLASLVPKTADTFTVFIVMAAILALLSWTNLAREIRAKVLALRSNDFVLAAKEMGASDARIIFRHLFPNTLSHIIVVLTLSIPGTILTESFLSFLGIGIQEPLTSWGLMMRNAQNLQTLSQQQWIMTPALFILIAVLGFNFLGDGLRDAADPYAGR